MNLENIKINIREQQIKCLSVNVILAVGTCVIAL